MALIWSKTRATPPKTGGSGGFVALFAVFSCIVQAEGWGAADRLRITLLHGRTAISIAITLLAAVLSTVILLLTALLLLLLRQPALGHQDSVVVLGVLEVVLRRHAVACRARVSCELKILLVNMRGSAADLDVRAGRIKSPVMVVLRPAAAASRTFHCCPSMFRDGADRPNG